MMWLAFAACLMASPAGAQRALITAQDHRGNRIEPFDQTRYDGSAVERRMRNRNCTRDRVWCADLRRDRVDGGWTLHILVGGGDPEAQPRHHSYAVPKEPCCFHPGAVWDEMVREPRGGALIGIQLIRETTGENGFRSYQRRLHLLRVPREDGGVPVPVLDAPLNGSVERPVCRSSADQSARAYGCSDTFFFSTLFTLVPSVAPVEPPDLIMVATAHATPGAPTRSGGPVMPDPVPRTRDVAEDPTCTFTRTYYFDEETGRYVPDAPLPLCSDYLEP